MGKRAKSAERGGGGGSGAPAGSVSHIPRPHVAARSLVPSGVKRRAETQAAGKRSPNRSHLAPPSVERKIPYFVPAKRSFESRGDTARLSIGGSYSSGPPT